MWLMWQSYTDKQVEYLGISDVWSRWIRPSTQQNEVTLNWTCYCSGDNIWLLNQIYPGSLILLLMSHVKDRLLTDFSEFKACSLIIRQKSMWLQIDFLRHVNIHWVTPQQSCPHMGNSPHTPIKHVYSADGIALLTFCLNCKLDKTSENYYRL